MFNDTELELVQELEGVILTPSIPIDCLSADTDHVKVYFDHPTLVPYKLL